MKHQIVYLQDNIYYNSKIIEQKNDYFFGPFYHTKLINVGLKIWDHNVLMSDFEKLLLCEFNLENLEKNLCDIVISNMYND